MKVFVSIFLLFSLAFATGVALELYDISVLEISLLDSSGEGSSEKDSSENAEDDSETDYFTPSLRTLELNNNNSVIFWCKDELRGHYKELLLPPPKSA